MSQVQYKLEDEATIKDRRFGSRVDQFHELLSKMNVGQSFAIPCRPRVVKGKQTMSPEVGFNVKAANEKYAPKEFKKDRVYKGDRIGDTDRFEEFDAIRVHRVK